MDTEPRWGSVIHPNEVVHRQNPLVFFVTFVVHFRVSRPSLEAAKSYLCELPTYQILTACAATN